MLVEPTRSQNSTLKCRRSPLLDAKVAPLLAAVPGAARVRASPNDSQNLAVSRLSASHFEQRIKLPLRLWARLRKGERQAQQKSLPFFFYGSEANQKKGQCGIK